jgi:hypothetical protein
MLLCQQCRPWLAFGNEMLDIVHVGFAQSGFAIVPTMMCHGDIESNEQQSM